MNRPSDGILKNIQADALIESGRPLSELTPLFETRVDACQYYARSMSTRYASPDSRCVQCEQPSAVCLVQFEWQANLNTKKTIFWSFLISLATILVHHVHARWIEVKFATRHRLCRSCYRGHIFRKVIAAGLRHVLFAILIVALLVTVVSLIFAVVMLFDGPSDVGRFAIGFIGGSAVLAAIAWGFERCRRWTTPSSIRHIGRFPFFANRTRTIE